MADELLSPLIGSSLRVQDREQLDEFLSRPDAAEAVKSASAEEVFFTIKHVGLADSLDLLPLISSKQIRGCVDLDCWRKDEFVRKPLMEWIAAFVQAGPEETVRALTGIDEILLALFLKDLIQVYEVDRDDPPEGTQLIFTPDNRFAVEPSESGEPATVAMLILDALFKYYPALGSRILSSVRYTTQTELEETAFQNKNRRLEVHGFVDYYDAMSIYSNPGPGEKPAVAREPETEAIAGEESPGNLPALFVDSLMGGEFLIKTFAQITDPVEADRFAQELTALGNRILSANLINLGDVDGIRPALEEMRNFLTIGLEYRTGGRPDLGADALRASYIQTIFKTGFDQVARLRDETDVLARIPGLRFEMFDAPEREFLEGLRRFKPFLLENGILRSFRSLADVQQAQARLTELKSLVDEFFDLLGRPTESFSRSFNTATVHLAIHGKFEPVAIDLHELQDWLKTNVRIPEVVLPVHLREFAEKWWTQLKEELDPLSGHAIDPRFIETIHIRPTKRGPVA